VRAARNRTLSLAVAAALALPTVAGAFEFDLANEDLSMRWDNTLRMNVSQRLTGFDDAIIANVNYDDGDRNFKQGSVFTRVDLLSEFDVVWKRSLGFRVSAAGWWDGGYQHLDNKSVDTSNTLDEDGLPTLELDNHTERYAKGPSAEFLDVFAFAKFNVGDAPVNLKLGQTTVYWGESLLFNGALHGVSYAQNPLDIWKALSTPGAEAKELFRPRVGFNVQSSVTDTLSIAAQYFFNWQSFDNQAYRYPESGAYLSVGDPLLWGADSFVFGPNALRAFPPVLGGDPNAPAYTRAWRGDTLEPEENSGNYGLAVRWSPEWLDGTLGFYYRRTYDMQPQLALTPGILPTAPQLPYVVCNNVIGGQSIPAALPPGAPPTTNVLCIVNPDATNPTDLLEKGKIGEYQLMFGEDVDIFGLSLSKQVGSLSLGAELSYRKDMPLLSEAPLVLTPGTIAFLEPRNLLPAGAVSTDDLPESGTIGAVGDTMHGLVNLLGIVGDTPLWDSASWSSELTWMTWLDVNEQEAVFKGRDGYSALDKVSKNYFGLGVNFTPTWFQVFPSVDVLMPLSWSGGIAGNSAVTAGGQERAGSFRVALAMDVRQKYRFDLAYVGFYGEYDEDGGVVTTFNGINSTLSDRDFIALTFKTTF
jgi:hypothetical protein